MNVEQAVEELKTWGLEIYRQENSNSFSGGTGVISQEEFPKRTSYYNPFSVYFDRGNHLWRAYIPLHEARPIIKIDSMLDTLVAALKQFYTLSKHAHEEPLKICAAFIGLQKLGLMADIFDDDAIRLRIPPKPYRMLGSMTRMMATLTMDAPEKEFYIRLEVGQWVIEDMLRVEASQKGRFSTLKEVMDHIPVLYPEVNKKRPMKRGKRLDKKLQQATTFLRDAGLVVYSERPDYVMGAANMVEREHPGYGLPYDLFVLSFNEEDQLWVAQLTFAQALPIIKIDPDLDGPLLAIKQFYALCQYRHEICMEGYIAFIRLQNLGLMADMVADDTIRVRIPPKPYRTLDNYLRMMASLTVDAPEQEFFIRRDADQWLIEKQLRVTGSQMGQISTLEEAVDHLRALYPKLRE